MLLTSEQQVDYTVFRTIIRISLCEISGSHGGEYEDDSLQG
jgi:hypothetical protein